MLHCFQNIWFNKTTYPNEHWNGYWLSTKWVLTSDQSCQIVACAANQAVVVCGRAVWWKGLWIK